MVQLAKEQEKREENNVNSFFPPDFLFVWLAEVDDWPLWDKFYSVYVEEVMLGIRKLKPYKTLLCAFTQSFID